MIDRSSDSAPVRRRNQPPADLMSELLLGMRLNGVQYRRLCASPPFGIHFGTEDGRAQFHFVACGTVFIRMASGPVQGLAAGDAVLLPRGGAHDLVSSADLPSRNVCAFG